jgi:hypothetical protein
MPVAETVSEAKHDTSFRMTGSGAWSWMERVRDVGRMIREHGFEIADHDIVGREERSDIAPNV